jgi:hypothetical protein
VNETRGTPAVPLLLDPVAGWCADRVVECLRAAVAGELGAEARDAIIRTANRRRDGSPGRGGDNRPAERGRGRDLDVALSELLGDNLLERGDGAPPIGAGVLHRG